MRGCFLQLHSVCKLRLYFWRVNPGNQSARAAVKQSCYRAFTKSKLGGVTRKVMQELSRIQATTRAINEHASYKARQDISGTLFMREQQSALLTGKGTEEHLSLIHSWLGHLLYVAVQRIKRLARGSVAYQELRQNTLRLICRARRALVSVWRRYVDTQRIGFKGPELWAFRTRYDEAELFAGHTSRAEMRAAFDYASDMCKRKGYKIIEGSYQC